MMRFSELTFGMTTCTVVILFMFTGARCRTTSQKIDVEDKTPGPRVLLSVSSLASHTPDKVITERLLELNWFDVPPGMNEDPTSWVGLFNHDPDKGFGDPLEVAPAMKNPDGYYRTNVSFPRIEFNDNNLNDSCLGYWIGYVNMNRLVAKSCIRARPRWMEGMRDVIGNRALKDIMIPGTHNAGSYEAYDPEGYTTKIRYQICHDESIFNQLVYGNRFLDLRVIFQHVSGSKEKFWLTHGIFRTKNTMKDVLAQVKRFLDNTNEIVIMDFHMFYMSSIAEEKNHSDLMKLIIQTLGHYMIPTSYGYSATLNDMWKSNKRLFVGYDSKHREQSILLNPGVVHLWGDKDTRSELETFLENTVCYRRNYFIWSAMAELTANWFGIVVDRYKGLRRMAQDVNIYVTRWFRDRWWQCANVVATDFFLGNNIIEVSIEANARKFGMSNIL